jgi:hypothetical protein
MHFKVNRRNEQTWHARRPTLHCNANHTATVRIAPLVLLSETLYHENHTPADM